MRRLLTLLVAALALVPAACGSSDEEPSSQQGVAAGRGQLAATEVQNVVNARRAIAAFCDTKNRKAVSSAVMKVDGVLRRADPEAAFDAGSDLGARRPLEDVVKEMSAQLKKCGAPDAARKLEAALR